MATKPPLKISELTAVTEATDTSFVPISSETETNKITYSDLTKGLAKTTDLTAYETTASLTTKLNLKADKTQLTPLAVKTEVASTYALITALEALEARVTALENL